MSKIIPNQISIIKITQIDTWAYNFGQGRTHCNYISVIIQNIYIQLFVYFIVDVVCNYISVIIQNIYTIICLFYYQRSV